MSKIRRAREEAIAVLQQGATSASFSMSLPRQEEGIRWGGKCAQPETASTGSHRAATDRQLGSTMAIAELEGGAMRRAEEAKRYDHRMADQQALSRTR